MPIFMCSGCGCIENTATSDYWSRNDKPDKRALCSECDPDIGKWHGLFTKRSAKGLILANDGFLYDKEDVESDSFKSRMKNQGLKIVKEITEPKEPKVNPCLTCSDKDMDADEEPCSLCGPPDFQYHDSKCQEEG
jgi:hypothetical protein